MSHTVQQALRQGTAQLSAAGIEGAAGDARRLMAHVLGIDPGRITLVAQDAITPSHQSAFDTAVKRRATRTPVSHITGMRAFYGRDFRITPDVLDPRPETESLIAEALAVPFDRVLDLGTGSGAILVTLLAERAGAQGSGADISEAALGVARDNAARLGVASRAHWHRADWCDGITGEFDLIVSNPPYIAASEMADLSPEVLQEPRLALTDEADGLSAYRQIIAQAPAHLTAQGWLMVEIGWQQGADVAAMMTQAGWRDVTIQTDLDGRDRVVRGRKPALCDA